MTIKLRLILSLALLALSIVLVGGTGLYSLDAASEKTHTIVVDRVIPLQELKIVADAYAVSIVDTTHKVRGGALSWEAGQKSVADALALIDKDWTAYAATYLTPEEKALVGQAVIKMDAAKDPLITLQRLLAAKDQTGLEQFATQTLYPAIDPISTAISGLIDLQARVANEEYDAATAAQTISLIAMAAIGAMSLAVLFYAVAVVMRGVVTPLSRMQHTMGVIAEGDYSAEVPYSNLKDEIGAMAKAVEVFRQNGIRVRQMTEEEKVAETARAARMAMMQDLQAAFGQVVSAAAAGDFSQRVHADFADAELNTLARSVDILIETVDRGLSETGRVLAALARADLSKRVTGDFEGAFAQLRDDTNAVGDKLTGIVGELRNTSRALKTATQEILAGANDLSERTIKQAATIEETSAAMDQLSSTVTENARRSGDASTKTEAVTRIAEIGGEVMEQANQAMERITNSSSKISNIIGLIDDIAFQTNLLALNASVEAARAGEAGKGFAVVAVEVRRLAQSAAQASSEVKVLIDQSSGEVREGSRLVADASAKLTSMLEAARENSTLMEGISRASAEQAAGIDEINVAVRQMDEMTQHNAALVEETNAAIEQTEAQASELDRIVDIFTLAGEPEPGFKQDAPKPAPQTTPSPPAKGAVKGMREQVASAARNYLSHDNTAIAAEWSEF